MSQSPYTLLKPLLRRTPFLPGESLSSLLERLLILNFYPSHSILEKLYLPRKPDQPNCPYWLETLDRLSYLTGLPVLEICAASDHRLFYYTWSYILNEVCVDCMDMEAERGRAHLSIHDAEFFRPADEAQFCPHCLAENAYHRLAWRPVAMAICTIHNSLLLDACQFCSKPLSIAEIVRSHCARCHADLKQMTSNASQVDMWGSFAQQTVWHWLLGDKIPDPGMGWPQQPPDILYSLVQGLAWGMISRQQYFLVSAPLPDFSTDLMPSDMPKLIALHPGQIYWAYTNALRWLSDWPDRFREFLQLYAPHGNVAERSLGRFYLEWVGRKWDSASFRFVHKALQRFWGDRASFTNVHKTSPIPVEQAFAYANLEEAAQISGISGPALMRLAQIGVLHKYSPDWTVYFLRSDLRCLQNGWGGWITLEEAVFWLGISSEVVVRLCSSSVLTSQVRLTPDGSEKLFVSRGSVTRLLSRIENLATSTYWVVDHLLSLQQAIDDLDCLGVDEAFLLGEVFYGRIDAYRSKEETDPWDAATIFFKQTSVRGLAERIMEKRGWLSAKAAARKVDLLDVEFYQLIELGLLKPKFVYHHMPYISADEVEAFRSHFITSLDAAFDFDVALEAIYECIHRIGWDLIVIRGADNAPLYLLPRDCLARLAKELKHL